MSQSFSTKDDRELKGGGHPKVAGVGGKVGGEENEGGKGGGGSYAGRQSSKLFHFCR